MFVEHPFEQVRQTVALVRAELSDLDAEAVGGPEAACMLAAYADLASLAQAGLVLAAGRVAASGAWATTPGCRSAKGYVSSVAGISSGAAERMIEFAERLAKFPATSRAFCSGLVSAAEAEEVTRAAARNAAAEEELLDTAQRSSFSRLRDKANATQSPSPDDDARRAAAARAGRSVRNWVDADGVAHLHARGPVDLIGVLAGRIDAGADELFAEARRSGAHEASGAYRFDALVALICGGGAGVAPVPLADATPVPAGGFGPGLFGPDPFPAHPPAPDSSSSPPGTGPSGAGPPPGPRRRPRVDILIRIDFAALRRGYVGGGETCEVAGIGPISVSAATGYLGDAALKFILTEGRDIKAVAHAGRNVGSHLRSALMWKYRRCSEAGCDRALGLEYDHELPFAKGGLTSLDNLAPKCHACHADKTRRDFPNGTAARRRRDSTSATSSLTTE